MGRVTTGMPGRDGDDLVAQFIEFQRTGRGLGEIWPQLQPPVAEFARRNLRKLGVWVRAGDGAVGDVESQTVERLMRLSKAGVGGQFDPLKAGERA